MSPIHILESVTRSAHMFLYEHRWPKKARVSEPAYSDDRSTLCHVTPFKMIANQMIH